MSGRKRTAARPPSSIRPAARDSSESASALKIAAGGRVVYADRMGLCEQQGSCRVII